MNEYISIKNNMSLETLDTGLVRFQHSKSSFTKFSPKFALFDLDGTLITTRSGNKFPKTVNDWKWLNNIVLLKIKELIIDKYNIIIVSNQSGAEKSLSRKEQILESVGNVFKELLNFYEPEHFEIYLSLSTDVYRKPNTTIFEKYIWPRIPEKNIERIFYVGDAAGREGDFADSDRKFAYNLYLFLRYNIGGKISVPFLTPEEFFLGAKPKTREWRGFNPREYYNEMKDSESQMIKIDNSVQTVLLLVGPPASGKSTMVEKILKIKETNDGEFCVVCQDNLKTKAKCLEAFKELLEDGTQLIIVDKTNPSRSSRGEYIDIVRQHEEYSGHKIVIKAIEFQCSPELAKHMNIYRERISFHRGNNVKRVPEIAYRKFWKDFQEPSESEDIDEVIEVKMVPEFKSKYEILMFLQKS